jgi:DNA-binding NtrC family response regulator
VGGSHTIRTDTRIIATTNRNLREQVEQRKFRQDLFYRLNVVPVEVPSLRNRLDDIPLLVKLFIQRHAAFRGKDATEMRFSEEALGQMLNYSWPGNVRELENMVERLCVMAEGSEFTVEALPSEIRNTARPVSPTATVASAENLLSIPLIEQQTILRALETTGGNRRRSAELLGISVRTLRNKLNKYHASELVSAEA